MATSKDKKVLIEKIKNERKFYEFRFEAYGGEAVMGFVTKEAYDYWTEKSSRDFDAYMAQPISMTTAIVLCVITTFSNPFKRLATKSKVFSVLGSLGLLPGFVVAGLVAYFLNEVQFNIEWGFKIPAILSLIEKTSPLYLGFPDFYMYIDAIPLVLIGYMLLFGDLVTGTEVLKDA